MTINKLFILGLLLGSMLTISTQESLALSIAVLPVADITYERDGVNFAATDQLVDELQKQGLVIIAPEKVIHFMIQERVRRCSEIDSFTARKMATQLQCDSILMATLYQQKKTADQSTIILTLFDGETGQPAWSKTTSAHLDDFQPVFGINLNRALTSLQQEQLKEIVHQLVEEIPEFKKQTDSNLQPVQIENIQIEPSLVKGGQPVKCQIKIDYLVSPPDTVKIEAGQQTTTLKPTKTPNVYAGTLTSAPADGKYSLNASYLWADGKAVKTEKIASYAVANKPAKIYLNFHNIIKLGHVYAFSKALTIRPRMTPKRPLEQWTITIRDDQNEIVFSETQHTPLPVEMVWRGLNKNFRQMGIGHYTLTLTAKDIAGNESIATAKIYMQAAEGNMIKVKQKVERGLPQLTLATDDSLLIPVDSWRLTIETSDGALLLSRKGVQLPTKIVLPEKLSLQRTVCHFVMRDKLGNQYTTETVQDETITTQPNAVVQTQPKNSWKADF